MEPLGDSMDMGVGKQEVSIEYFRGLESAWKNGVGSVDLRMIKRA